MFYIKSVQARMASDVQAVEATKKAEEAAKKAEEVGCRDLRIQCFTHSWDIDSGGESKFLSLRLIFCIKSLYRKERLQLRR